MDRYEETLENIQGLIASGAFADDGRLPTERRLCEDLGVGRRVLRRALGVLEDQGRISRRQGRGTFVVGSGHAPCAAGSDAVLPAAFDAEFGFLSAASNPVDLIELRIVLEPVMCRLAALRASRQDVEKLRQLAARTAAADTPAAYEAADRVFHAMVAELARNTLFIKLQQAVGAALRETAFERFGETGHCFKRQAEHASFHHAISDAIGERDACRAERLMHEHLTDVHRSLFCEVMPAGAMSRRMAAAE